MVDYRRRGRGFETYLRRLVSLSKTLYSPKVLVIPRKRWLHPDMTEIFLTWTLNLNTTTTVCIFHRANITNKPLPCDAVPDRIFYPLKSSLTKIATRYCRYQDEKSLMPGADFLSYKISCRQNRDKKKNTVILQISRRDIAIIRISPNIICSQFVQECDRNYFTRNQTMK